jgi:molybdate transport system permease protein
MANTKSKIKPIIEAIVSLPLAFSPESAIGSFLNDVFGLKLAFSFSGLVIGSIIYSLPFMIQPLQAGFAGLPSTLSEASFVLGKSKYQTITKVLIPNIKKSILTGIVLTFAHTVGEFGVVLMIGGNIPNQTKVVSIAIYDEVESLNYSTAHVYSGILLAVTFAILLLVYINNNRPNKFSR